MPTYTYSGVLIGGKRVRGELRAGSLAQARASLRCQRIHAKELKEKPFHFSLPFLDRVKLQDLSQFTRHFATMTAAGLPMVQSLDTLAEQTNSRILQRAVRRVSADVQGGLPLAEAMAKHPKIFSRLYCVMVKAGEAGGILDSILLRLANYQEKAVALRRKIKSAMTYPIVVACVAIAALVGLFTYVVPTFSAMLADLGADIPAPTQLVLDISNFLSTHILTLLVIALAVLVSGALAYQRSPQFRLAVDNIRLILPLFGNLEKKSTVARFARTFGALLSGGVPISEALEITAGTADNRVIEAGILDTLKAIQRGKPIAEPLQATGVFPPMVVQMISVGEKSGNVADMLERISGTYDSEVDAAVTSLTSIIEPVMILIMGIVIAGILIAMYLPMFDLITNIG